MTKTTDSKKVQMIKRKLTNSRTNLKHVLGGTNMKRKSLEEYKQMPREKLYLSMISFVANYENIRQKYIKKCLEFDHLLRQNLLLQKRIDKQRSR